MSKKDMAHKSQVCEQKIWIKVYESQYIAYLTASGSKRETTK